MFPAGYNNAYQIVQTPGYVTIVYEMIHDARIIPLNSKQPRSPRAQSWMGDSRGHWEGDTLVVETTNFNDKGWITTSAASGRIKGVPHTDQLRVVERFTRVAADKISYSATIEDPEIYTAPWTVSFPLTADPEYRIFDTRVTRGTTPSRISCAARGRWRRLGSRSSRLAAQGNANARSVVPDGISTNCCPSSR